MELEKEISAKNWVENKNESYQGKENGHSKAFTKEKTNSNSKKMSNNPVRNEEVKSNSSSNESVWGDASERALTEETIEIDAYSDANWAGDRDSRKSQSGLLIQFNKNSVSWASKKQTIVAQSTAESEYIATAPCVQELIWIKQLCQEIFTDHLHIPVICRLHLDNKSAIDMSKNDSHHSKTKHIDIKYHFIKDCLRKKEFTIHYVKSANQLADILTKPLQRNLFTGLRNRILNLHARIIPQEGNNNKKSSREERP